MASTVEELLDKFLFESQSTAEQGSKFERLIKAFLLNDVEWNQRFDAVWEWMEWPDREGTRDTGIDLVARYRESGDLVAVQCKFYDPETVLSKQHIDSFLSDSGKDPFKERLVVSTALRWGPNAEAAIRGQSKPVHRIGLHDLVESSIDWEQFDFATPEILELKERKRLRPHQSEALSKVRAGFEAHNRGKLIMACGTGKTFTSLKIVEDQVPLGGSVLFLVPSIALLSQTLREWSLEAEASLRTFAVCSDIKVGRNDDSPEISVVDLAIPATTDPVKLAGQVTNPDVAQNRITVVFSTYQSIDVVAKAQKEAGLPDFDMIICDEAHRTTGATLANTDESAFVKVHNEDFIKASKRLYMTATPRIYDDNSKAKAGQANAVIASMDDETYYGPEFHRLGFGEAVSMNLLTDYKVLVLAVDEGSISKTFQGTMEANSELNLDDVARIVGCWNGLAKIGQAEHDFAVDPEPMKRAVAFSRDIKASKQFAAMFDEVIGDYVRNQGIGEHEGDRAPLDTSVHHVDGSMNILTRNEELDWLKTDPGADACRILTNAKCLSEGVDVPALDAVMFLNPRKSVVDVVQSVGRVMRRAPGKKYGYIILPIGIPAGTSPEEALRNNDRYRVVWEVLQALRAHDERFNAMVNKLELNKSRDQRINVIGIGGGRDEDDTESTKPNPDGQQPQQLAFDFAALEEWCDAIYAKIVQKVGTRRYWEDWAKDVAQIAERHRTRLLTILDSGHAADEFTAFHKALQANLNDGISRDDAIDMLSQHMITKPVFDALFSEYAFADHNPVSKVMQTMLETLEGANLESETEPLEKFYESVRLRAAGIDNAEGKQRIITELYERFFKLAFPRAADALGIVYTPTEIVDFIIRSVDHLSREHFGKGLTDEGVHVLDPFTGTGTFITRLIASGLIEPHDLARKYASELHANEIMLLAYYIAAINIETTYQQQMADAGVEAPYKAFDGIVLTDTFQMTEKDDIDDLLVFTSNNARVEAQRQLDIRVIIGNPPYSVGQTSGNDNNANVKYPHLDKSIETTFAAKSTATNKNSLYDSYIRAIRWSANRIGDAGLIGFVTNGGFIDANTADGLRKTLADEFTDIYIYNLRGNQRTAGEQSRKEGGKVFGSGSRNTVAITFLVKNPAADRERATVHYRDIGDYLTREDKLAIVNDSLIASVAWQTIQPNDAGDWTNQRSSEFENWQPIGEKLASGAVFRAFGRGPETGRDAWVYNYSSTEVVRNIQRMVEFYNHQVEAFARHIASTPGIDAKQEAVRFIDNNPTQISWTRSLRQAFAKRETVSLSESHTTVGLYRPFTKQMVRFGRLVTHERGQMPSMFPTPSHPNRGFVVTAPGSGTAPFSVLASSMMPDVVALGAGNPSQFFARYAYEPVEEGTLELSDDVIEGYRRVDNITDATLKQYRSWYGSDIAKDDIFAFIYGFLHSPDYRSRFAADLKRSLPRIPRIGAEQFPLFRDSGKALLDLHIGYENVDPYPVTVDGVPEGLDGDALYDTLRVQKMKYGKRGKEWDKTVIHYSPLITVSGIPEQAQRYMLGSRSGLDWIIDRYQVKTDKASGIVNDPNDWSREVGNPRYILDLIAKAATVSVETMKIVDALPDLEIVEEA
ncbi:DEAD/DEAH box helicase family protein [Demequina sp. B12]|uniref:DEAD/DEAH box helicase n=1 Tax=Demequina sp. B12 TaxID=2992757 RepID=UPI00237BB4C6|nr:type ISP restriction/modification enzyme [Demequina sp. B12]MDE0573471.1 DEAD/DEAH box helicase family protein [Demequina sp. B12]